MGFVQNLKLFGIDPIVVTVCKNMYIRSGDHQLIDNTLLEKIPTDIVMETIESELDPIESKSKWHQFYETYFSIHGRELNGWRNDYNNQIGLLIEKYNPELIFATIPPFGILPLVAHTSKKYKIPLMLDFRDAWSQWNVSPYGSILHYWATIQKEKKYIKHANAIIATSKQTITDFKNLYPNIKKEKFHYIPNGYDGQLLEWKQPNFDKEIITIGYVGSFYYSPKARHQMFMPWWRKKGHKMLQYSPSKQDWLYRSPYFFFRTMQQLKKDFPDLTKKIRIKFAGKIHTWMVEMINEFDLANEVKLIGEISHNESLLFQQSCDVLLITSAKYLGGKDYSIAGKTYEYFKVQKPILAFVCEGAQKDILVESGMAIICDPDNIEASSEKINDFLLAPHLYLNPNLQFIQTLSRFKLTESLANLIKNVIASK